MAITDSPHLRRTVWPAGALLSATAGVAGVGLTGFGVLSRPGRRPPTPQLAHVLDVTRTNGALQVDLTGDRPDRRGWWGLRSADGTTTRAVVGPRLEDGRRDVHVLDGHLATGDVLEWRAHPWQLRDAALLGLEVRSGRVDTPHGQLPVDHLTSDTTSPDRALVFVHGRGASRTDGLWLAPTAARAGWQVTLAGYRNDADAPATGRYLLGGEWEDLAAVVDDLRATGIRDVVLVGASMGGNICASYMRHVDDPGVSGVVLDAPALDWSAVVAHVLRRRRLPAGLAAAVLAAGRWAAGVDWGALDHLRDAAHLRRVPVLALHGTEDDIVPVAITQRLAVELPDAQVELFAGAGHCRSVNSDPGRYLGALRDFLARVA